MKKLDDILRAAKPAVPDLPEDFSQQVMSRIEKLDPVAAPVIRARQPVRWTPLLGGLLLLSLSLITVNNVVFEIQMNGSLEMLTFGTRFLKDVLTYIPFDLILPALIVTTLASWLMWHSNAFKRGIAAILLGSFLTTTFGGAALAATGINDRIQRVIIQEEREWPLVSWFFKERARYFVDHPNFRMGRVEKTEGLFVWIIDPRGRTSRIELPAGMQVREGQIVSLTGVASGDLFRVNSGHHCNPGRAGRYFHHMSMMNAEMNENMREHHRMMRRNGMMMQHQGMRE
ncbi:hypothetical protein KKI24_17470 [bacterium]|nr:hypothetical protein [bacterium]